MPNSVVTYDLTDIATKLKRGAEVSFSLRFEHNALNGTSGSGFPCYTANAAFTNPATNIGVLIILSADYSSVFDFVTSGDFENAIGTVEGTNFQPIATAGSGLSLTDFFNAALSVPQQSCSFTKVLSGINDSSVQQGFKITASSGSNLVSLQIPAMKFQSPDGGITTDIYEYYSFTRANGSFTADANKSTLHSNRDYETGIVYLDEYARASTVLVCEYNTVFVPVENSITKNRIQATVQNYAPSWAKKYKFVAKPSKAGYETIYSNFFYTNPFDNITHFKLDGDNQNKVQTGDRLIVKKDADGALSSLVEATVLEVKGQGSNFLNNQNELGTDSEQLAGLYMQIKVSNFNATIKDDSIVDYGEKKRSSKAENTCRADMTISYPLYSYTAADGSTPESSTNYSIPGGSIISLKFGFNRNENKWGAPKRRILFDKEFVADQDYNDFRDWWNNTNIDFNDLEEFNGVNPNDEPVTFADPVVTPSGTVPLDPLNPLAITCASNMVCLPPIPFGLNLQFVQAVPGDVTSPLYLGVRCTGKGVDDIVGDRDMSVFCDIVVQRADSTIVFETIPGDGSDAIFLDASESFDIVKDGSGNYLHQSGGDTDSGEQNQTSSQPAIVTLDFMDCYVFGNGVESYKYLDRIASRSVVMGQRALAVSNQDVKEADRFASITYSGLYSFSSGLNNLNEFNLGLINFKDVETSFGPITKLHGRETDVLCLQEDRISYVQGGKNLLSDAVGGGAVVSTPEVLGLQIARIEEYGNSFNPESFIQWGKYMYFTDTKRLAVLRLGAAGNVNADLSIISDTGMRSWFRDQFIEQLNTQKLGGFDPYMDEYVLSTNNIDVPVPIPQLACGIELNLSSITQAVSYTYEFGSTIGTGTINYNITGSATITILWNGATTSSGAVTGSGSFNWSKTATSPSTALITITPSGSASVTMTPDCIPEVNITVIKAVINSPNDSSDTIHVEYSWADSTSVSPVDSDLALLGSNSLVFSEYFQQTGVRSQGVFPYDGINLTIRLNKLNVDTYDFIFPSDNFKYLSSNTLYANTQADVTTLLGLATTIPNSAVSSPSPAVNEATVSNLSLPIGNQYLYIIYDLRTITAQQLCQATTIDEACCDCTFNCTSFGISSSANTQAEACALVVGNTNYHNGTGTAPAAGDIVYTSSTCADSLAGTVSYASPGYYKITFSGINKVIQIGSNGLVLNINNC